MMCLSRRCFQNPFYIQALYFLDIKSFSTNTLFNATVKFQRPGRSLRYRYRGAEQRHGALPSDRSTFGPFFAFTIKAKSKKLHKVVQFGSALLLAAYYAMAQIASSLAVWKLCKVGRIAIEKCGIRAPDLCGPYLSSNSSLVWHHEDSSFGWSQA